MIEQAHAVTSAFVLYPRGKYLGLQMPLSLLIKLHRVGFHEAKAAYAIKSHYVALAIIDLL